MVTASGTVPSAIGGSATRAHLAPRRDGHGGGHRVAAVGDHLQRRARPAPAAWRGRRSAWSRSGRRCRGRAARPSSGCRRAWPTRCSGGRPGGGPTSRRPGARSTPWACAPRAGRSRRRGSGPTGWRSPTTRSVRAVGRVNCRVIVDSGSLRGGNWRGALPGHHDGEAVGGGRTAECRQHLRRHLDDLVHLLARDLDLGEADGGGRRTAARLSLVVLSIVTRSVWNVREGNVSVWPLVTCDAGVSSYRIGSLPSKVSVTAETQRERSPLLRLDQRDVVGGDRVGESAPATTGPWGRSRRCRRSTPCRSCRRWRCRPGSRG